MADHGHDEKKDEATASTSPSFLDMAKYFSYALIIITITMICVFVVFINPETAQNFIFFLYGIEILAGIYIVYNLFILRRYMQKFAKHNHEIFHFYDTRYVAPKDTGVPVTALQQRFERATKHITSQYREEWKIGIIELDTILKDLLKDKYKKGDTVGELLKTAGEKGMGAVNLAWEAHRVRNMIVHEGIKYEISSDAAMQAMRKYTTAFKELGLEHYVPNAPVPDKIEDNHAHH